MKRPSFEVEEEECRQRQPSILKFGGSCSSIVVLTTSLMLFLSYPQFKTSIIQTNHITSTMHSLQQLKIQHQFR